MRSFCKQALLSTLLAAMLTPAAWAATNKPAKTAAVEAPRSPVVARVNGKEILKEHFDIAVNNLLPSMTYHNTVSDEKLKAMQKRALDNLINNELIYKYAQDNKTAAVDAKEIDKKVEEIKKNLPPGETLEKVLKRSNLTYEEMREDFNKDIVVSRTAQKRSEELKEKAEKTVTEDFMRNYYKKNLSKFREPEQVHVLSILIKADPSGGSRVWESSRQRIENVLATINQGMEFSEAAKEFSEDPYAQNGGDMGWLHKGSILAEIDQAIENLKVGEIAGPFASLYGYHLIKLEGLKPAVQRKFEELNQAKLKKELQDKEYKKLWKNWLDGLRETSKVEYVTPVN